MSQTNQRNGAQLLVECLLLHDVDTIFCVPGESYLAVLDALHDAREKIRIITCRHEAGAANMAEAYGKLTGKPGICMVTRGPGATHGSVGLHTARQDSTPMIMFIGQVARGDRGREAFQEIDYGHMLGPLTKWVEEISDAGRVPEYLHRAFQTATSGRPGPVALSLPEDMQTDVTAALPGKRYRPLQAVPRAADIAALQKMLGEAERPFVLLGGGGWSQQASEGVTRFLEAFDLPAASSFRAADRIDNAHPSYIGDVGIGVAPHLQARLDASDLVIAIGPRLGEMTTGGYTRIAAPMPAQKLIHVHPGAEELGSVYQPDLAILAGMTEFAEAVAGLTPAKDVPWGDWRADARADYEKRNEAAKSPGAIDMIEVMRVINTLTPEDAIMANGAGNYSSWAHSFFRYRQYGTQLAPTSGAMGYGLPAAIAAKVTRPERCVVCLAGDGEFMMTGNELATAVQYGLDLTVLIVNNGMYGTIRMHQERDYPDREVATRLVNPDFAAFAQSFGAQGEIVAATDEFEPAFARALAHAGPSVIELRVDPDTLGPKVTLSGVKGTGVRT